MIVPSRASRQTVELQQRQHSEQFNKTGDVAQEHGWDSYTMMGNYTSNFRASVFGSMQGLVSQITAVVKDAALWLYHALSKFAHLVSHGIGVTVRLLKNAMHYALNVALIGFAGCLIALFTYAIARLAYNAYKSYRTRHFLRDIEEARERERTQTQAWLQEQAARVPRQGEPRGCHQEELGTDERAQRQRAAEQSQTMDEARRAEERARVRREEEQQQRRLRALQRFEDQSLYRKWKAACDSVFDTSTGELPEPPSWPCPDVKCQGERNLKACYHSLERLFGATGNLQETLKQEYYRWHPNRAVFHRPQQESERMATEISQAIQYLLK